MLVLKSLALNWIQCQISLGIEMDTNAKTIVWMRLELLDGIELETNANSCLDVHTINLGLHPSSHPHLLCTARPHTITLGLQGSGAAAVQWSGSGAGGAGERRGG